MSLKSVTLISVPKAEISLKGIEENHDCGRSIMCEALEGVAVRLLGEENSYFFQDRNCNTSSVDA